MKTTFSRTFTTVAVILLVALLLVGISFQVLVRNYIAQRAVEGLKRDGQVIAQLVQAYSEDMPLSVRDFHIALTATAAVSGADAVICDAEGSLLFCADEPYGCEHSGLVLAKDYLERTFEEDGCVDTGIIDGLYADRRYVVSLPIRSITGKNMGIVIMSEPVDTSMALLTKLSEIFVFVSLLAVLISMVIMTVFARKQSTPLREMARVASAFGHGDLTARVNTDGRYSQEVEELALAFNNMASSLQKSEYQRQEFVANVSHELKTPMTTIAGFLDGILDGTIPQEKQRQYLTMVSAETKRLSRLVRSMLDISRLQDQGTIPPEQISQFDLTEQVGQVLISLEQRITAKNLDVQVQLPEHPVYTKACQDHITQVIYNLLDNAVKFSPQEGVLGLSVQEGSNKVYVSISNEGETIPSEELPLVFDRFHKTDKSRSKNRDSWGLGLYIVKTIIGFHGENISVTSREGKTTFTFTLPLEKLSFTDA